MFGGTGRGRGLFWEGLPQYRYEICETQHSTNSFLLLLLKNVHAILFSLIIIASQIIQASAYGFYIVHGSLIGDPPVVLLGITSLSQSMVLIVQYFCFRSHYEKQLNEGNGEVEVGKEGKSEV